MARIRVGTSGWSYRDWHGPFYPPNTSTARELAYASTRFPSLEVNRSFYSLLTPQACRAWYEQTPRGFVFALKGSQFITHSKRLRDVELPLANFFASGVLALEDKLGPIVWQLSRRFAFDADRLDAFFSRLPRTTTEAALLARRHDGRVRRGVVTDTSRHRRLRHAIEPRHESFADAAFARLARRHGVAIAVSDAADWPCFEEVTAGFVYVRLHGSQHTYVSGYTDRELDAWAERIRAWASGGQPARARRISETRIAARQGRDVYVYFDNDTHAHAPRDAQRLAARLGVA